MKKILIPALIISVVWLASACNNATCTLSREDSIRIASAINGPNSDTVPDSKLVYRVTGFKMSVNSPIEDDIARREHIAYLMDPEIQNSQGEVVHSLYIPDSDIKRVAAASVKGAKLHFCISKEGSIKYLGVILVPLDAQGRNILEDENGSLIMNKVEPCPDKCPEGEFENSPNHVNDLNYNKYQEFNRPKAWFKRNTWRTRENEVIQSEPAK